MGSDLFISDRAAPAAVRATGRLAARSRGLAAPLAVARAHGAATAVTPLLAVTVAVALVVLSGTLVQSVRSGQRDAADLRVGGDVRLDGRLDRELGRTALAALPDADGVVALASGSQLPGRTVGSGLGLTATLLVVDAAELARVRADRGLPVDAGLAALGTAGADGAVPALVSAGLLDRLSAHPVEGDLRVGVLGEPVAVDVRGTTAMLPDAGAPPLDARAAAPAAVEDDGLVVVDRSALVATGVDVPAPDRAWLSGPGAVAAVTALALPPAAASGITVTTHDGWSRAWTGDPLTAALQALQAAGVGVLALLLVLTLVLVVVATSRERGRTLSTLRTLGLDAGTARAATLGELAPLVVGGLLGGAVIGLVVPWLVTDALGLPWLTGDPRGGRVAPAVWPVVVAAGALLAALAVAVGVEQAVRRRDRLGDVLRVGDR
ncbi:FtsX-like permease family protein [Cellulomonas sp. 179-A 9B4 NHS]|uniref:FtsX-like permease family protein n=1 Tax=Cellulomonas sp. 179-A 9B4 NHS TaxID=3142379 RepID=UPI0039A31F23